MIHRPSTHEYDAYYGAYVDRVPDERLIEFLQDQKGRIRDAILGVPSSRIDHVYAPGKWTTREVVGHMLDAEWVFVYRTLRIARGDATPLADMDQDTFSAGSNVSTRSMASLAAEFEHLRTAAIELFGSFDDNVMDRRGTASGCSFTVRALMFIVAGHAEHHLHVIEERYL